MDINILELFKYFRQKDRDMGKPLERLKYSITLNNLWLYVIKLVKERPMYSREIHKMIKEKFNIKTDIITVYSVLYRLERGGFIKRSGNYRKYYKLTEKGEKEFQEGLKVLENVLILLK